MPEKTLKKIKNLPKQNEETLNDALGLATLSLLTAVGAFFCETDITPIATVAGLSWAETAACNAFYFWKAKHENRIKLAERMIKDLADQYGIEAVTNLTNIILRD